MDRFFYNNLKEQPQISPSFNKFSIKKNLNPQQFKIVNNINGTILVIAGAGSGKTRTITYSVLNLIIKGIKPSEIMLVTFTNKAAKEMLKRVEKLLTHQINDVLCGTFHSIANKFIRKFTYLTNLKPNYSIIDQIDSYSLMKIVMKETYPNYKLMNLPTAKLCYKILSYKVNVNKSLKEVLEWKFPHLNEDNIILKLKRIFNNYTKHKLKNNVVDFNDLLLIWNNLLDHKEVVNNISNNIKYVFVDEYQDTNYIQAEIIFKMAQICQNIMIVGDDAQSIYSFRGANFKNLLNFRKKFKNVKEYKITRNYRSTPEILNLANDSIKNNKIQFQKNMNPIRKSFKKPEWIIVKDEDQQAEFIIEKIKDYINKIPLSEIAILYRSNFHSLKLQKKLQENNIPYEIRSGITFFEQAHIKDVIAHLKILQNPHNELAWHRIFQIIPGLGRINAQKLINNILKLENPLNALKNLKFYSSITKELRLASRTKKNIYYYFKKIFTFSKDTKPSLIINLIKNQIESFIKKKYENFEERIKDIEALNTFALNFKSIMEFLDKLNLNASEASKKTDLSLKENNKNKIILSTIHKAKGLEWKVVFIINLLESYFPYIRNLDKKADIEEERRIFYVAITRAKDILYLLTPKLIHKSYGTKTLSISRFIKELNPNLYNLKDYSENIFETFNFSSMQKKLDKFKVKKNKLQHSVQFVSADKLLKYKN
ncbi:MAG: ATP-dependent helicase [Promethearchaeota archaeon]